MLAHRVFTLVYYLLPWVATLHLVRSSRLLAVAVISVTHSLFILLCTVAAKWLIIGKYPITTSEPESWYLLKCGVVELMKDLTYSSVTLMNGSTMINWYYWRSYPWVYGL